LYLGGYIGVLGITAAAVRLLLDAETYKLIYTNGKGEEHDRPTVLLVYVILDTDFIYALTLTQRFQLKHVRVLKVRLTAQIM
jgi:hypothetical protein